MPTFLYPLLAGAGAIAASVPVIVHLLNRRRFRVVQWAAMDFLREAVSRSRRILELRDLLLLVLRVLCLLAFALALGRPFWNRSTATAIDPNQPVHAIVLVDNSLSMSYQKFDGILLDEAKAKARELIDGLPRGSTISVLPTCGSSGPVSFEAYTRPQEALEALAAIKPVDRTAMPGPVISMALEACHRAVSGGMPPRIFLVTDDKVAGWSAEAQRENLKQLPCPMQISQVSAGEIDNAWVADVQLRDGVADAEAPAVFIAKIGYRGPAPRANVPVTLKIDGTMVSSQSVNLQPGQVREVTFPEYHFPAPAEKGETSYSTVEVSIPHDRLPGDDQCWLTVPVTAALPVVFVDALGEDENPKEGQRGDTWWLRRLLAPHTDRAEQEPPLIQVRQLKMGQLSRESLAEARLVVIAGVASPTPAAVQVLTQFVEQGGSLILAGGGGFDPEAWNKIAWKDGAGILPAPLEPQCIGCERDDTSSPAVPFVMNVDSCLAHPYFWPAGESQEEMRALLGPPTLFFKAMVPQCGEAAQGQAAKAANDYFGRQRKRLAEIDARLAQLDSGKSGEAGPGQKERDDLLHQREEIQPSWLAWRKGSVAEEGEQRSLEDLSRLARPVVVGRYSNEVPMFVRRQWGKGTVLLLTTSLSPQWTTMPELRQSWWLMDRVVRSLLTETLKSWNFNTEGSTVIPVAGGERSAHYSVTDPDGQVQVLTVDAQGGDHFVISLGNWTQRGIYRVTAARTGDSPEGEGRRLWEIPLTVNGPAEEALPAVGGAGKAKSDQPTFADATAQAYSITPVTMAGVDSWKWWIGLCLALLLAESFLAARYTARPEAAR